MIFLQKNVKKKMKQNDFFGKKCIFLINSCKTSFFSRITFKRYVVFLNVISAKKILGGAKIISFKLYLNDI